RPSTSPSACSSRPWPRASRPRTSGTCSCGWASTSDRATTWRAPCPPTRSCPGTRAGRLRSPEAAASRDRYNLELLAPARRLHADAVADLLAEQRLGERGEEPDLALASVRLVDADDLVALLPTRLVGDRHLRAEAHHPGLHRAGLDQ